MPASPRVEPRLLKVTDTHSIRYEKTGRGPPPVLVHTIRTQLEYFRALEPELAKSFTLKDTGHFAAVENPLELARVILES